MAKDLEKRRDRIRHKVERYGLRVICLDCAHRWRWIPQKGIRLRILRCERCGESDGAVRALWWVLKHPQVARRISDERAEVRQIGGRL